MIEACNFRLGLLNLLAALLTELVMMSAQKRHLFEKNMVFFRQQVDTLPARLFICIISAARLLSTELLKCSLVRPRFFYQAKILTLLDLKCAHELIIFKHDFAVDLSL